MALAAQHEAVATWIAENSATVLAEFTEAETGSKARPELGRALASCRRDGARILIARTNPIGSGEAFGSLYGGDIGGVRCVRLTQPVAIVVYLRTRPSEPTESEASLSGQRTAVATWLAKRSIASVAEFIETEADGSTERPALDEALATCRREGNGTTLLVGTLAPIGAGRAMRLPPTTVPIEVASRSSAVYATEISLPSSGPPRLFLYFGSGIGSSLPVYLWNSGPDPIHEVQIASIGETIHGQTMAGTEGEAEARTLGLETSIARRELKIVPAAACLLVDTYDLFRDSDFVTSYEVTYSHGDSEHLKVRGIIGAGGPTGSFVQLTPSRLEDARQTASI